MGYARKNALRHETIARITWGESPRGVTNWLIDNGIAPRQAASFVRKCVRKRARDMRVLGTANLLRGLMAIAAALCHSIGAFYLLEWLVPSGSGLMSGYFGGLLFAPAVILAITGVHHLWLTFDRVLFGAKADGPVTDIDD